MPVIRIKHKKIMVKELQERLKLPNRKEALKVFDTVIDVIKDQILNHNECWIRGFGKWNILTRPARYVWNPYAGKEIYQPERKMLRFHVAREFFKEINK